MDFFDNVVNKSNALIKERLNNPFGARPSQTSSKQDAQEQQSDAPQANDQQQPTGPVVASANAPPGSQQATAAATGRPHADSTDSGQSPDADKNSQFAAIAADAEAVAQKAAQGAKSLGTFLFSMANKAGQQVQQTAKQVKQAVESTSILTDFTREQQDFIKEHGGSLQPGQLPWENLTLEANEEPQVAQTKAAEIREQVLSLSQDKRNFVRGPPSDANFEFDAEKCYPIALSLLKEDPNLSKIRFELVPKLVNEDTFWRNYFYRVTLLKQMCEKGESMRKGWASSRSSSGEGPDEVDNIDEPLSPNYSSSNPAEATAIQSGGGGGGGALRQQSVERRQQQQQRQYSSNLNESTTTTKAASDLIADYEMPQDFESSESRKLVAEADDLKSKLKELNIGSLEETGDQDDDKWEEELQRDLQEFELVSGCDVSALDEEALEDELMGLPGFTKKANQKNG